MNLFVTLKYLVALDDHRHFGRAALACHVTQPALSNAIRALEESFGSSIVKRGRNFAGFTAEGERVLLSARRILREHELLRQDLSSAAESPTGELLIGAVPTAMPIASRFVAMLQDRHPGIVPTLRSMSSVELETGLETLALDMGLGYAERTADSSAHRRVIAQYVEHYFLARRVEPGQPRRDSMAWADAATLPLCLLTAEMHNRTIIDRAFAAAGAKVRPAIESNSTVTLVLSVQTGRVGSILPGSLLDQVRGQPDIEVLPLVEPCVEVPIAFLVHNLNPASRTLKAALELAQDPLWLAHAGAHSGIGAHAASASRV
jgi:DNA-binding transcriptional LysR family regulator